MRNYVHFYTMSTGYIEGSTPPQFDEKHKKPIEACGSDGVLILDGSFGTDRVFSEAIENCKKYNFIGFRTYKSFKLSHCQPNNPKITYV